jgi:hypothetical protein
LGFKSTPVLAVLPLELQGKPTRGLKGHVASFFFLFYNFNNAGIVTNEIFKKYVQDKIIFALFLRPKDIKKVFMEGNERENKKKLCQPLLLSPKNYSSGNRKALEIFL